MRSALRFTVPVALAALWAVVAFVWIRSYWCVDKVWIQVLPKVALEAQLTPGQLTCGSSQSAFPLPFADSHWFSWPVDSYYADYIPPPSNTLVGEFHIYNGSVTFPLWFLALLAALPSVGVFMPSFVRSAIAYRLARASTRRVAIKPGVSAVSLLRPSHPLIAVGPGIPDAQAASAMHVVS